MKEPDANAWVFICLEYSIFSLLFQSVTDKITAEFLEISISKRAKMQRCIFARMASVSVKDRYS